MIYLKSSPAFRDFPSLASRLGLVFLYLFAGEQCEKHTECFNARVSDGKDHPFDASRLDTGKTIKIDF
jgi:hypothetical protein